MKFRPARVVFAIAAFGAALTFSSCSGGTDDQGIDTLAAISFIDGAELHAVDTAINEEKTIPADAQAKAVKLESVMAGANWPEELEDEAEAVEAAVRELAKALDADAPDLAKAGAAAKRAHETSHDFSGLVWNHIREEAGLEVEEGAGHD
ncbi:MAG: hypothetical protein AB7N24_15560 [Dehalococcoidia bacterium]